MRVVARGALNVSTNFVVSVPFSSPLIGQYLSHRPRNLLILTLEVAALGADMDMCTKLEVRRPFRSEDIEHLLCEH